MSDPSCSNSLLPKTSRQVSKNACDFKISTETLVPINKASNSNDNGKISTSVYTNTTVEDLSKRVQNTNLSNCDDDEGSGDVQRQESSLASSKKKNLRKRERRKALQIQGSATNQNMTQPIETPNMMTPSSMQDLFSKQISPLYAVTNSRYLENLSHHPQFNLLQAHHFKDVIQSQLASSVPNSPLLYYSPQGQQYPAFSSFPNTPEPKYLQNPAFSSFPNSPEPKYLQNVMQHPLLSQTFYNRDFNQVLPSQVMTSKHSNQHICKEKRENGNRKNSKNHSKKKSDNGFNPYISREEVEKGLKNNELLEGVVRINPKQFTNAYISSNDKSEPDVLIDGVKNRNRALEGDIVVVQIIECFDASDESNENKQKQGRVVQIKEKVHSRTCIGSLKLMPDKNKQKALFIPRDYRMPRLNISVLYWPDNFYEKPAEYEKTLFLAKIIDWYDVRFAVGKIVCNIGMAGDMESETKAILAQNDLDVTPYGPEYKSFYPGLDYEIPEEEIKLREDCRNLCIFSIDPFNCRDIDDAVSSRKLENGNYEIGVHISDVSHFLTEGTLLDEKVSERATTIYMVERAYHMLPDELCMLCSLLPGVDKLAFSVFWEITMDGKVLSHRFAKTVINSCCKLAYEHAQSILDDEEAIERNFPDIYNNFEYKNIYETIKILGSIATIFRKRRFDGGALRIDQPKISFKLGPNALPDSFSIYDSKPSHQLIEEFMLLANMTVAERIFEDHPKFAFLRCHPAPSIYMLNQLAKALKPIGITLEVQSAGDLHKSLQPHLGPNNLDRGKAMVLNMLCAKPMARAKYFCAGCYDDDFSHYALNVPLYTHFTSPIRRYADVVVHRLLSASLSSKTPEWETDKIRMIAANCNKQKYNAKKAGELSIELYTLKYIELNSPLVTEAVVVDIKDRYLDIIIVAMGLNRRIFLNNDFPGEFNCIKNDAGIKLSKMELVWNATDDLPSIKQEIEVFTILNVEMHKGDDMVKVETKLVRPQ